MPDRDAVVSLEIDGRLLRGWESIEIERSVDQLAGTFRLSVSENHPDDPLARELVLGAPCSILLDDEPIISGYLEDRHVSYASESHGITVGGRDLTGDLIDCSADRSPGGWTGQTIDRIVGDLIAPFEGITLTDVSAIGLPFKDFRIQTGETVFETISRATRMRGLVPVGDGLGGIRLWIPGSDLAPAEINRSAGGAGRVLGGSVRGSIRNRFSRYRVLGQATEISAWIGEWGVTQQGIATDPGVGRHRPLVLIEANAADTGALRRRAQFESTTRAARATPISYRVQGWRSESGWLWSPGYRLPVFDPLLGVGSESGAAVEMMISSVSFSLDDSGGQVTDLSLLDQVAFQARELTEGDNHLWSEGT